MATQGFTGFSKSTFSFLRGLEKNNNKAWFEAHRVDYDTHYVDVAKAFVAAIGPKLQKGSSGIHFEPRVNGSLFRINRDVRFSKDKAPYKAHLDLWFWEGEHRGWEAPGLFFRLRPSRLVLGAGMHRFDKGALERYRRAVLDDKQGKVLQAMLDRLTSSGDYQLGEKARKKVPRGYDAGHARAELLLYEGITVALEEKVSKQVSDAKFVDYCVAHYRALAPVNTWLQKHAVGK